MKKAVFILLLFIFIVLTTISNVHAVNTKQVNTDGFGDANNIGIYSMTIFNSILYICLGNYDSATTLSEGLEIWRSPDGSNWTEVVGDGLGGGNGFGDADNLYSFAMKEFNSNLYAGTYHLTSGCAIWRSSDGTTWTEVVGDEAAESRGFGNNNNFCVYSLEIFGDYLYAGTVNIPDGCQLQRSTDGITWTQVNTDGFGDTNNFGIRTLESFGDYLYAGTFNVTDGCEIWRSADGENWNQVIGSESSEGNGFGDTNNGVVYSMGVFKNYLYAGTRKENNTGCELWRSSDGTTWAQAVGGAGSIDSGFADAGNTALYVLTEFGEYLYAGTRNNATGCEIWRSKDGESWSQTVGGSFGGGDGFGDSKNTTVYSLPVFGEHIYTGTYNTETGCEIWRIFDDTTWYLAEGCTAGFDTWVLIQNPNSGTATYSVTFMDQDGNTVILSAETLAGNRRTTYYVNSYLPDKDVSTKIESDTGIIAERSMYWAAGGGHCSIGVTAPRTVWYLAEGCTTGYDTWVLIQNPNAGTATYDVTFMDQDGNTVILSAETLAGNRRTTYHVNNYMANKDVSTKIESDIGIIAERAMYWSAKWGHCSRGVSQPSTVWYLAEGCTRGYDTWILIQNPNSSTATYDVTFMDQDGNTVILSAETLAGNRRTTYHVNNYMANKDVSTKIESDIGIIAERAMYWATGGGHCSIGVPSADTTWLLAEGCTRNFDTWILIQNPNSGTAAYNVTFMDQDGNTVLLPAETLAGNRRTTYYVNSYMSDKDVSTKIESDTGIIAERAMYWSSGDGHCSRGCSR